jgi:hypothetical protein
MQLKQNLPNDISNDQLPEDQALDGILKEAAEGYGDLMAAALIHRVSMKALQSRLKALKSTGSPWIS